MRTLELTECSEGELGSLTWRIKQDGQLSHEGAASYNTPQARRRIVAKVTEDFMGWRDDNKGSDWRFGEHRVQIHRHIDFPPQRWFVSCYSLGIERLPLKAEGFDDASREAAKQEAIAHIETYLVSLLEAFEAARDG